MSSVIKQVKDKHPFPWTHVIGPTGVVVISDASGVVVPLLTLVDFTCAVTLALRVKETN